MERTFGFLEHLVCDTTFSMLLVYPNKADAPHRAFGRLLNAGGGGVAVPRTPPNRSAPLNPIIRRWFCAMNQRKISFGFFADEFAPIDLPKNGHYFSDYLALRLVKVEFPHSKSRECPHSCPRIEAGYVKRNGSVGGVFLHGGTVSLFINVSASYYTS